MPLHTASGLTFLGYPLPNMTIKTGLTTLGSGWTTVYTCPTGRRAMCLEANCNNSSGGSVGVVSGFYFNSVSYHLSYTTSIVSGAGGGALPPNGAPVVLEAGNGYALFTTATGLTAFWQILEFDDTSIIKTLAINPATGDNTLYTVPSTCGGALFVSKGFAGQVGGNFQMSNEGGATRTFGISLVPNGTSLVAANLICLTTCASANQSVANSASAGALAPGDSISVNIDVGTGSELIYTTVIEIPL